MSAMQRTGTGASAEFADKTIGTLVDLTGAASGTVVIKTKVTGDTQQRFTMTADGTMSWGPGNAVTDVILARSGVGALSVSGSLGVGAAVTGLEKFAITAAGSVTSVGGVPVWNAVHMNAGALTITGSTHVTTATGVNYWQVEIPVITTSSALTVDYASTFTIMGPPAVGGGAGKPTITNGYAFWVQSGITRLDGVLYAASGSAGGPGIAFGANTDTGFLLFGAGIYPDIDGTLYHSFVANGFRVAQAATISWNVDVTSSTTDLSITRIQAGVLAQQNADSAQEFRVYGATTGAKYASLLHNGTDGLVSASSGFIALVASGNQLRWDGSAHYPNSNNVADSGGTGVRWHSIYVGTSIVNYGTYLGLPTGQISFATGSLATGATTGYRCITSSAGPPTGVPANIVSGQIPEQYDSTNDKWYIYRGGWKKAQVNVTGVGVFDVVFA